MYECADPERSAPKIHEEKSGRPLNFYSTYETYATLWKFQNRSWLINNGVRLASSAISQHLVPAGTLFCIGSDSKYDETQDWRLQLFADNVAQRYYMTQLANPAFFDYPNPKSVQMKLERLWEKLCNDSKLRREARRRKSSATASMCGALFSLVTLGAVCALTYPYIPGSPLPDLGQYHVLWPVVLSPLFFLLISPSLRAICRRALDTLRQKLR